MTTTAAQAVHDLRDAVGAAAVDTSPETIARVLEDHSWLSPILLGEMDRHRKAEGHTFGVEAVVRPATHEAVLRAVQVAVRHRLPVTPRGGSTSNFGLVEPDAGGVVFDLSALHGTPTLDGGGIRAPAGVTPGEMESVARSYGYELPVLPTTHATSTVGGWIAGGHVGLGSSVYGTVWDGLVTEVRIVTAEDEPRSLTLTGDDVVPVLHTFGSTGLVTEVVLRVADARRWTEAVAFFPSFDRAARFVRLVATDDRYPHRVVAAQDEELMPCFSVLRPVLQPGPGVLMIIDSDQVDELRGQAQALGAGFVEWQPWQLSGSAKPPIAAMVYGHRMLWIKNGFPEAAFLHVYFDPEDPDKDVAALRNQFGRDVLMEMKYIRSPRLRHTFGPPGDGPLPAAVITVRDGQPGRVEQVMQFCDRAGIPYRNPHTNVLERTGVHPDAARIAGFKREVDPHNLLNPGRLESLAGSSS